MTLSEARTRARQEASSANHQTEREKADLEVRSHVLSLREGEPEERLRKRERDQAELESQVRALTVALRKEQANAASAERRLAALQAEVESLKAKGSAKAPAPGGWLERQSLPFDAVERPKSPLDGKTANGGPRE